MSVVKRTFNSFIDFISGSFAPFLGVLAGIGILKGVLALCLNAHLLTASSGTYEVLYAASDGLFFFLPLALAVTAANNLQINPYTALAIAGALVYPDLVTAIQKGITFAGIPVLKATYSTSVIPIILIVLIIRIIEPWLFSNLPKTVRDILTPLIIISVMVPCAIIAIGPLGTIIGSFITKVIMSLYSYSPLLAGIVLGAFWQILVIFGLHWAFIPVFILNLSTKHFDPLLPILFASIISQVGAAAGASFKFSNAENKSIALSGTISGLLGITEPIVYGITLKYKKPMLVACIASGIGGGLIALMKVTCIAFTLPSILALTVYQHNVIWVGVAGFLTFFLAAIGTYLFGINDETSVGNEI